MKKFDKDVGWSQTGTIVALLLSVSCRPCMAGPPFFTDDPQPVDYKHWEVYLATQHLRTADGRSGTAPHIEVNYGAYPNLQLHGIVPLAYDHPISGPTTYGYGDTELGAKYRFIQETDQRPQIGTFPLVEAPTGNSDRGIGNGKAQVFLPLWLQKSRGPWTSYGGGGYWINPGEGKKNWGYVGWLLQRNITRGLTLGGEVFHRTPDTVDGESGTGFTGGGQINFGDHYHLLFSGGRDFSGPDFMTGYLALQWTF